MREEHSFPKITSLVRYHTWQIEIDIAISLQKEKTFSTVSNAKQGTGYPMTVTVN